MTTTSTFAWLDFSERDRRRALEIVDLLKEDGTQDELGIGVIRDAFADSLFPGTSTIQTRLRYFLFIPWVYRELERRHVTADHFAAEAWKLEMQIRDALLDAFQTDTFQFGRHFRLDLLQWFRLAVQDFVE